MKNSENLMNELAGIDGKGYGTYKDLEGQYKFKDYILSIDHVQGDPFAAPSRVSIIVDSKVSEIPYELFDKEYKKTAAADFLTRLFYKNIKIHSKKTFGSGKSGLIFISACAQEVLERTSVILYKDKIESRIEIGFPARGRRVLAMELKKIFFEVLPKIVENTFLYKNINKQEIRNCVNLAIDQQYIRENLKNRDIVAFVANGSMLPRESGVSSKPLKDGIKFKSPKSLEIEFDLPNKGIVKGMGIKEGITLIVGGGYHGKSTLLKSLELGVYNHIEGDGREFVISDSTALKVRAEDGRIINNNDISLFINNLPNKKSTKKFYTENASGSTSEASNIIEGIESGAKTLLIDEDTSATNFMVRDDLMQKLVSRDKEPITPFIEIASNLFIQKGISTIIVVGSSGDYFDIADTVILMDEYTTQDVTDKAKELSSGKITERIKKANTVIDINFNRIPKKGSIEKGPRGAKIKTFGTLGFSINREDIDLKSVEQIADCEQVNTLAEIIKWADKNVIDGKKSLTEIVECVISFINKNGLISINPVKGGSGKMAMVREQEIMASFNRYRRLNII